MPKPKKERSVRFPPPAAFFRPVGVPFAHMERVVLNLDEFEALRLVDYEGMDQLEAAEHLGVSRPTCARILESGRKKCADALVHAKAMRIEGGMYRFRHNRLRCLGCGQTWDADIAAGPQAPSENCPRCGNPRIANLAERAGFWQRGPMPGPPPHGHRPPSRPRGMHWKGQGLGPNDHGRGQR